VKLNIQKIAHHPALGAAELEQLGIAESGIQQVEKLVKDILSYARAPKLAKSSFQLESLLEEALRFVEEPIEEKEIRVVASFEELAPIVVDGDQLRQAFLNILLNATEAVGHGGTIGVQTRLRSTPEGSVAEVSIEDDGVGIEETDRQSIFDAFFTTKSLGTGLGLTNARKVIELHRGAIEVASEVGRGTRVTVVLPYEGAAPTREIRETIASTP
jgi:signal transduction histidine kinase